MGLPTEADQSYDMRAEVDDLKARMTSLEALVRQVKSKSKHV